MPKPHEEQPSTYFVQDRSNRDEMIRLEIQQQMLTAGMGGVLPEQPDPALFHSVLDVGCATGGWLIEAAKTSSSITKLVGVDISGKMIEYAQAQAKAQQVSDRVEFHAMDALRRLEFPDNTFDLVNHRFTWSWIRQWDWVNLLREYQRVCKTGGIVRLTEFNLISESSSKALLRLNELVLEAFWRAGHISTQSLDGVTTQLPHLLQLHGLRNIQTRAGQLQFRVGTPQWHDFFEDNRIVFRNLLPFLRKWIRVPDDYEDLYQQMLTEFQQPDFETTWSFLTVWGTNVL